MIRLPRLPLLVLAVVCGASLAACLAVLFDRAAQSAEPGARAAADEASRVASRAARLSEVSARSSTTPARLGARPAPTVRRQRPESQRGSRPDPALAEAVPVTPTTSVSETDVRPEAGVRPAAESPSPALREIVAARWIDNRPAAETGDAGAAPTAAAPLPSTPSPSADSTDLPSAGGDPQPDAAGSTALEPPVPPVTEELPVAAPAGVRDDTVPAPRRRLILSEGDGGLAIDFVDEDIRNVLNGLSQAGGFNVVIGQSVQGKVSAALNGASIEDTLGAILKSTGYVARWEGNFLYVGTPQEFQAIEQLLDTVGTRVYRPNYVTAEELKKLITPLLTPEIGRSETTAPAKQGIQNNVDEVEGNNFAGADALLVQDYECVLSLVDQVVAEVDRRPVQVAIEAMILSVRLDDTHEMGVDFQFLRDNGNVVFGTGDPLQDLAEVTFDGGLKFAYLDGNYAAFLSTLESIGDTNVIATPRLMVLNKHRAQILIGSELGYVSTTVTETSTSQTVEFLQVGTQLRLRPFVSDDGRIRMEIHPELSTGVVAVENGFTLPEKEVTEVTTNVMVPDGATMVLGGLMREDLVTTTTQVPFAGSLPVVGALFRHKEENTERREILVLVTPRIISEPEAAQEGHHAASEFHRRQSVYADQMSPFGKRHLGRKYFRMAQEAWAAGDADAALRYVELAVHFDPMNRAAIDLRADVWAGSYEGDHSLPSRLQVAPPLEAIDGAEVAPWIVEELETPPSPPPLDSSRRTEAGNSRPPPRQASHGRPRGT